MLSGRCQSTTFYKPSDLETNVEPGILVDTPSIEIADSDFSGLLLR